jgi:hypothetical protein
MLAKMTASFASATSVAAVILIAGLSQDAALGQAGGAAQSPADQNLEPRKTAPGGDNQARMSVAENSQPAQAATPDPLLGDWRVTYLADSSAAALKVEKVARGVIGASLTGTFLAADGRKCPVSGAIFQTIAGMYPDGAKIVTMDITGMMRVAVQCDGPPISIDAFLIEDRGKFSGAGRATAVQSLSESTTVSTIRLEH